MNDDHKPGMNRAIGEVLDGLLHAARAEDEGLLRQVENDETIQRAIQSAKQYDWDAFRFGREMDVDDPQPDIAQREGVARW